MIAATSLAPRALSAALRVVIAAARCDSRMSPRASPLRSPGVKAQTNRSASANWNVADARCPASSSASQSMTDRVSSGAVTLPLSEERLLAIAGCAFQLKQAPLRREPARRREAGELAVRTDDAMAGNDDRERVPRKSRTDVTCGIRPPDGAGDVPVRRGRSRREGAGVGVNPTAVRATAGVEQPHPAEVD